MKHMFLAALLAATAMPAMAGVLPVNGGWQGDSIEAADTPSANSPWTVTFTKTGTLWLVDCCIVGDIWTVSGDLGGVSSFYVGGPLHPSLAALFEWTSADYSKLQITGIAPGTYTFDVTGDGAGGLPAGFSIAGTQVPEAATWAMMIAGFGMIGAGLRRRTAAVA
jgi:hypothetical protein